MVILCLFLFFLPVPSPDQESQAAQGSECSSLLKVQSDAPGTAASCEEVLRMAISRNESFKNAVSDAGQRAFRLEMEHYYNSVLLKQLPSCVTYASACSDRAVSKLMFELASSYAGSPDAALARELARFFLNHQDGAKALLLEYEAHKRRELIEVLKLGLAELFPRTGEEALRLGKVLTELESR